eukprot:TRINITY_DN237_c3_g1_i1.p1 TRINITY_DN237_c3_g1~~TRINITY_DN237_c3_g1_i1.p1  ORF type:complete len:508 (+),score=70.88 TRINITY_DN237_c3_g1_i1:97-1620(+)
MKPTSQPNDGPMTIYKRRNEMGLPPMKRKSAVSIAKRIKALVSSKRSANSSSLVAKECDSSSESFCYGQALIQNYSNFRRSGTPSRFMFFRNDAWTNFSEEVFGFLKAGFVAGMPVVECSVEGSTCLFDFLRMLQFDSVTGHRRSIGWIDVNGQCFFPKLIVGEETRTVFEVPSFPKLEIEIRVNKVSPEEPGKSSNSAKEYTDESHPHALDPPKNTWLDKPCIESVTSIERPRWPNVEILKGGDVGYMGIKSIFLSGIGSFNPDITITSICKCLHSGPLADARLKAFQSQIAMTKAARGNPNVKLAWYGTSAEGVAGIVTHGFGQPSRCSSSSSEVYGVGLYLSPQHLSHMSASPSSADGNGENHVILCRVILGKTEKIDAGSLQFHRSSEEYDCGVDDLVNPRWYIVWSTHMNQYILPEYVVSFKSSDQLPGLSRNRTSTSPIVSFQKLFSEMGRYLPLSRNQALGRLHAQYKAAKISKDTFVRQIRLIAGDKLLISTIRGIRGH